MSRLIDHTYRQDSVVDASEGPVKRKMELILWANWKGHDSTLPLAPFDMPNPKLVLTGYNGAGAALDHFTVTKVDHTLLQEKLLSQGNLDNTLVEDIRVNYIECTGDKGWARVDLDQFKRRIEVSGCHLQCTLELQLTTIKGYITHWQRIDSVWKDYDLLANPGVLNGSDFKVQTFGYHKTITGLMAVDSVALQDTHDHHIEICYFTRPMEVGVLYSSAK